MLVLKNSVKAEALNLFIWENVVNENMLNLSVKHSKHDTSGFVPLNRDQVAHLISQLNRWLNKKSINPFIEGSI